MCSEDDDIVKRDSASLRKIEQILDALAALAKRLAIEDEMSPTAIFVVSS